MLKRLFIATLFVLTLAQPAGAALVADYQFQNNYNDTFGSGPAMVPTGSTSFATETVNGGPRIVLQFPQGVGLRLNPTTGLISNTTYSVAMLFRLQDVYTADSYIRILDTSNHSADNGLYVQSSGPSATYGVLNYYLGGGHLGSTPINKNEYVTVVFTRDAGGQITGYVNGVQQFQFSDGGDATILGSTLYFFLDESNENSAGAVSRIQLYNTALTAGEVAAIDLNAGLPVPTLSESMLIALGLLLAVVAGWRLQA